MKKIYPLLFKDNCTENSVALNGFLQDNTLDEIIETYLGNLLGDNVFSFFQGNFPISVEIKREMQRTPIKVSPNNDLSLQRYECWGKERMIYIISARKDSSMYIGFQKSLSATELYEKCQKGIILEAMNEIEPEEGETFYIRPGVPFSIGPGISYLELSQNSPVEFNIENMEQMVEALDFIKLEASVPEYIAPEECLFRMESVLITFVIVMIGWVLFRADTIDYAVHYVGAMFGTNGSLPTLFVDQQFVITLIIAVFFSFFGLTKAGDKALDFFFKRKSYHIGQYIWVGFLMIMLLVFSASFILKGSFNPFIYFRF